MKSASMFHSRLLTGVYVCWFLLPCLLATMAQNKSLGVEHFAGGGGEGKFAIRTVKAARTMSYGQPFKITDLIQQKIAIYRSEDGPSLNSIPLRTLRCRSLPLPFRRMAIR